MKKYFILFFSILIQICLGGIYAWSSFVPALQETYGMSATQTQMIFGLTILLNTIVMLYAGRLLARRGPRFTALFGGIFFGGGYLVAAFSGGNFWLVTLGISVLSGIGIGLGYITPLVTCMKWFPENEGLVTGVSVAGFGAGAIFLSWIIEYLFSLGFTALNIFAIIGYSYGIIIIIASIFLAYPDSSQKTADKNIHFKIIFNNPLLWLLAFSLFSAATSGLVVIGNLKPMALYEGFTAWTGALAISCFAAGNSSGRIVWGWLTDKIGRRAIPISLFSICAATLGLRMFSFSIILFLIFSFLTGFSFGACFVVYVAYLAERYGSNKVGSVYPPVFLAFGIAGTAGPSLGGYLFELTGNYGSGLLFSASLSGLAVVLVLAVFSRL